MTNKFAALLPAAGRCTAYQVLPPRLNCAAAHLGLGKKIEDMKGLVAIVEQQEQDRKQVA